MISNITPLRGEITVPGDKSITHRAVMFGAIAEGQSTIRTALVGRDNLGTIRIMRELGVRIDLTLNENAFKLARDEGLSELRETANAHCEIVIDGQGIAGLTAPKTKLDCGNSGTTARLLCGLLSGRPFASTLSGDESLSRRPFKRVIAPLSSMGAKFSNESLPFTIEGGQLVGIDYHVPVSSAQIKSAILLAGLQTSVPVSVTEPRRSRDHTERMLSAMGCELKEEALDGGQWRVSLLEHRLPLRPLSEIEIPGDFSAAAFFIVAALIVPGSLVTIRNVGFNETRIGLYLILQRMGARIKILNKRRIGGEDVCDLEVEHSQLNAISIGADDVALAIDEIPIFACAAAFAKGVTIVSGAEELRVKESDRIKMIVNVLASFGVEVDELEDGFRIAGGQVSPQPRNRKSPGSSAEMEIETQTPGWVGSGDHRIAMTAAVLQYGLTGEINVFDTRFVETSFPGFLEKFQQLV